jgi:LmbE family N-acetylglucosaminyl deacetylase
MAHPEMTHAVDITDAFGRKVAALQAHASQTAHMGDQLEAILRDWGSGVAQMFGLRQGRLGECFHIMDLG